MSATFWLILSMISLVLGLATLAFIAWKDGCL